MKSRFAGLWFLVLVCGAAVWGQTTPLPVVRFHTNLGDIDVQLLRTQAPKTVANFLNYVNRGDFKNSVFHRSVPSFIIQGGGYQWTNNTLVAIPADTAVKNEYSTLNTRGTLAMAKTDGDPNSATNQWFFNTSDNSKTLNTANNGGFTVFGKILSAEGIAVMDAIAAVPIPVGAMASPYDQIPLQNWTKGTTVGTANLIVVSSIEVLNSTPLPAVSTGGIATLSGFGGAAAAAPGSYIEIFGSNLAGTTRSWADTDFVDGTAPASLDNVSVTIGGQAAYVNYVSPTQVNVQVPENAPFGDAAITLTYQGQASNITTLPIRSIAGGLLAPASFKVNGKQYVVAQHANGTFVSSGNISGVAAAPALSGEILTIYGVGFGPVTPAMPLAGQPATALNSLKTPVEFAFGTTPSRIDYQGLAVSAIGLYQFNVAVPAGLPSGDIALNLRVGGQATGQTLWISIK